MMTNIKKMLLVIASFVGVVGLHSAPTDDFNFELYNKAQDTITINLSGPNTMNTIISGNKIVSNARTRTVLYDLNEELILTIGGKSFNIKGGGKTKYLTWDPSKSMPLYPQTGSMNDWWSKTDTGLSLKNNVTAADISKR